MNSRARAAEVFAAAISKVVLAEFVVGSSTSFSGLMMGCLLLIAAKDAEGEKSLCRILLPRPPPALVRAASEPELLEDTAALREASAVFAETEAVGGPDTKMDRNGGSNVAVGSPWSA